MGQIVQSLQANLQTAAIALNGSLSAAVDLGVQRLARLHMPAAWDGTTITFSVSADGNAYGDLYDSSGSEYKVTVAANRSVIVPYVDFVGVRFIKLRSGTSAAPVVQTAARSIGVIAQ